MKLTKKKNALFEQSRFSNVFSRKIELLSAKNYPTKMNEQY